MTVEAGGRLARCAGAYRFPIDGRRSCRGFKDHEEKTDRVLPGLALSRR